MKKLVSIIIPCHNEEGNIDKLLDELNSKLVDLNVNFEYIFVNDGSTDKTLEMLNKAAKEDERVKVIDFSRNFGKEAGILAGLDYSSGDAAVVIDADLQMPVRYIIDLIKLWQEGNKLVLTYRDNRQKGLKNYLAARFYGVYNRLSDASIINDALDFQIMDREVIDVICSIRERERFFKGITGYIGYDYKVIPVTFEDRNSGTSKFSGLKNLTNYAFKSIAIHSNIPLLIAIRFGILISVLAFLYMIYIIIKTLVNGVDVDGYASTMVVMLFMFGLVFLFLGIMGYYLSLIYGEVKKRPNYIVQDKKNINKKVDYEKTSTKE